MVETNYGKVTAAIADELRGIVGAKNVVHDDADKLESYSHDEVAEAEYAHMPEAVVRPQSAEEIAAVVRLANRERIPVTPRGAGSGLSGGAVPLRGGIVILFDRMNRILEIDPANLMAVVEPGVVTNDINTQLVEHNLVFAGYPMSLETCYIGGNVAENAGGGKAVKYGVTGRYITGLELVTPTGEIVQYGGKCVKDVTGYNMVQLMIGSEGTLGIFTKVWIKLLPLPKAAVNLLVLFETVQQAIDTVPKIMTASGIIPTAIEFMDRLSVQAACKYLNETIPYEKCGAMLLIEVDGTSEDQVERDYEAVGEQCFECGAIEVYVADNHTTRERIWKVRRNIAEAFKVVEPHQSLEDIVVPIAAIPAMIPELEKLSRKYDIQIPCYGHAGDGNLHATPVKNPKASLDAWHRMLPDIMEDLFRVTATLGGTISGEHGIGHKRKAFLPIVMSEPAIEMMRQIKRVLDPNNILNPGKIFDV